LQLVVACKTCWSVKVDETDTEQTASIPDFETWVEAGFAVALDDQSQRR
jgi:hypothetical protein